MTFAFDQGEALFYIKFMGVLQFWVEVGGRKMIFPKASVL